jgi:hypothetical protein
MDPLLAKVFPQGRKIHAHWLNVHLGNCQVDSSNALKQCLMKILSLLFLIRHTILTWGHPTSGFSAISGHLLQTI